MRKALCSASLAMLIFACNADAAGDLLIAQIEAHGAVAPPVLQRPATEAAGQNKTASPDDAALKSLDRIYSGHSMHAFWMAGDYKTAHLELLAAGMPAQAVLYGEVQPDSFMELLHHVGIKPGMKYYDLGSGTGKTVFAAWLLGLDATGVELVEKRHSTACQAVKKAEHLGMRKPKDGAGVSFVRGSFLDIDFSDADIIFTDSASFSQAMMLQLGKLGERLKPGTKIISTTGFPGEGYHLDETVLGKTSRSTGTAWSIQTVQKIKTTATQVLMAESKQRLAPASLLRQEPLRRKGPVKEGPILGVAASTGAHESPTATVCSFMERGERGQARHKD